MKTGTPEEQCLWTGGPSVLRGPRNRYAGASDGLFQEAVARRALRTKGPPARHCRSPNSSIQGLLGGGTLFGDESLCEPDADVREPDAGVALRAADRAKLDELVCERDDSV